MSERRCYSMEGQEHDDEEPRRKRLNGCFETKAPQIVDNPPPIRLDFEDNSDTIPVDTPALLDQFKNRLRGRFGATFASETDFEYFAMLPIPWGQRDAFVARLKQLDVELGSKLQPLVVHS